jgi:transcriptional regulator of acetoin/glycerol metabolism
VGTLPSFFQSARYVTDGTPSALGHVMPPKPAAPPPADLTLAAALDAAARVAIARAWRAHEGNLTHAAATLGVSARTLHRELVRLALWPELEALGYARQAGPARRG